MQKCLLQTPHFPGMNNHFKDQAFWMVLLIDQKIGMNMQGTSGVSPDQQEHSRRHTVDAAKAIIQQIT
jgi:hypothetical protein